MMKDRKTGTIKEDIKHSSFELPPTKLSMLRALIQNGEWQKALAFAARFPRLGKERSAILDAHEAMTRPEFYRQLKKDPQALVNHGIEVLKSKYLMAE